MRYTLSAPITRGASSNRATNWRPSPCSLHSSLTTTSQSTALQTPSLVAVRIPPAVCPARYSLPPRCPAACGPTHSGTGPGPRTSPGRTGAEIAPSNRRAPGRGQGPASDPGLPGGAESVGSVDDSRVGAFLLRSMVVEGRCRRLKTGRTVDQTPSAPRHLPLNLPLDGVRLDVWSVCFSCSSCCWEIPTLAS